MDLNSSRGQVKGVAMSDTWVVPVLIFLLAGVVVVATVVRQNILARRKERELARRKEEELEELARRKEELTNRFNHEYAQRIMDGRDRVMSRVPTCRPQTHSSLEGKLSGGALEGLDCIFVDGGDDNSWGEGACWWQPANAILIARAMGAKTRTFSSYASC